MKSLVVMPCWSSSAYPVSEVAGQALAGQLQAQRVHLVLRHEDGLAVVGQLVRAAGLLQRVDDRAGVLGRQVVEQDRVRRCDAQRAKK
jgi:hypothetical protein